MNPAWDSHPHRLSTRWVQGVWSGLRGRTLLPPVPMEIGSIVFLVSVVAALLAVALPVGVAAWRGRRGRNA